MKASFHAIILCASQLLLVLIILLLVLLVHNVFLAAFYCLAAAASFSLVFRKKVYFTFLSWQEGEKRENSGQERDRRFLFKKRKKAIDGLS
jgi:hypothetical protein